MSGGGQKSDPDGIFTALLVVGLLALLCAIIWHVFRLPLLEALRWVRWGEMWVLGLFSHQEDRCLQWLMNAKTVDPNPTPSMIGLTYDCFGTTFMTKIPAAEKHDYFTLTGNSLGVIERMCWYYYRWPICAGFAAIGVYTFMFSPRSKFRNKYTLESFIKVQSTMWPVITPIVDFNPIKSSTRVPGDMIPDKLPLFAEALSPEEWISYHRIPVTNGVVDREAARRALILQLGPRWTKIEDQPAYIQALYAAFALKGAQKREESDEFLGRIAPCWSAKSGFQPTSALTAEIKKILADPNLGGKVTEHANLHAYRTTALLNALRWARANGGVLAPGQFVWLRGVDRHLWYALNNLGRRSFHSEGMGAIAHFMAEQAAKKPLPIPRVDTAIVTLNQFLADPEKRSIPIPPREGDKAKKGA